MRHGQSGAGHQLGKLRASGGVRGLTWSNGRIFAPSGWAAFPVIPRCSALDLVRLWCDRATGYRGRSKLVCGGAVAVGTLG